MLISNKHLMEKIDIYNELLFVQSSVNLLLLQMHIATDSKPLATHHSED